MARTGDVIENPRISARMVFLRTGAETNGQLLEADLFVKPGGKAPPRHIHPFQEERFSVVTGSLTTWISGKESAVTAGEESVVPKGAVHTWWNSGDCDAHVRVEFRPAIRTEGLEAIYAFAQDGVRNPLQFAVTFWGFREDGTLPGLAPKTLLLCLAFLGRLLGYQPGYPYPYGRVKKNHGQS
jgi:quercetin dioxygenase-like cupin family protein